ncbi:MAG: site-specific integrase [Cyclobacteriaceae bacterium]|nr:site-specific integrase [Cyclobacteriaceae bacterium]
MAKRKEGEVLPTYILWAHSSNAAGLHPVKIRLIHHRHPKYYPVMTPEREKLFLDRKTYQKVVSAPLQELRGRNRELRELIEDTKQAAKDAIRRTTNNGKSPFSFSYFEREYLGQESNRNLLAFFSAHIEKLQRKGQAGTARTYSSAYSALKAFLNGRDIDPADLTVKKLHDFDDWLRKAHVLNSEGQKIRISGKNDTSVSVYMRCLRSIYNELAASDDHLRTIYPFSRNIREKGKYKVPTGSGGQKGQTLSMEEMVAFIKGTVDGDMTPANPMYRARQLFLFSFFAGGMNFKDIALLRNRNVDEKAIQFVRQKTIRTAGEGRMIRIPLVKQTKEILLEQGNPSRRDSEFVFQVFESNINYSEKKIDDMIRQWIKTTNKWLRRYCERNNLVRVSTYAARHSFASLAKSFMSVASISEIFGHSRITTTQTYLGRFTDQENRENFERLFGQLKISK